MTGMSITPDAVLADAAWVRGFAEEIIETDWPAVGLAGSDVIAAASRDVPGLESLAKELRGWADAATAAADALASAELRAGGSLAPQ